MYFLNTAEANIPQEALDLRIKPNALLKPHKPGKKMHMHVCICYVYVYTTICTYICICICICIYIYIYICVCVCAYTYIYIYIYTYSYVFTSVCKRLIQHIELYNPVRIIKFGVPESDQKRPSLTLWGAQRRGGSATLHKKVLPLGHPC